SVGVHAAHEDPDRHLLRRQHSSGADGGSEPGPVACTPGDGEAMGGCRQPVRRLTSPSCICPKRVSAAIRTFHSPISTMSRSRTFSPNFSRRKGWIDGPPASRHRKRVTESAFTSTEFDRTNVLILGANGQIARNTTRAFLA